MLHRLSLLCPIYSTTTSPFLDNFSSSMATETKPSDFIFRSKLPDISVPRHLPLHTYCFEHIAEFGSRPCLINGATGEKYTYDEVRRKSIKVAKGLSKLGFRKGDVAMLLVTNSPDFAFVFLAASFLGAITTAANPFFTPAEIEKQAKASKAKIIITQAPFYPKVKHLAQESEPNSVKIICTDSAIDGCLQLSSLIEDDDQTAIPDVKINPDDVVALPYSSGTTGFPKGVMLTHRGLVTSISQQVDGENPNLYYHKDDVILCVLPLFHIYALNSVFLCSLRVGAAVLIMQKYEIVSFLQMIEKYKVSSVPVVPPIVLAMARSPEVDKYDLSSIRVLKSGGAPLGKEIEDCVKSKFPMAVFGQGYGMTEAGAVLTMSLGFAKRPWKVKAGACGTVVRNAEMKIVDTETGASLPCNSHGEICIRGDQIMKGYLDDPEATARTIDEEGWLHTGDIGFIDEDDELFIVDRLKELIKFRAFQVAPAELEAILLAHPSISDAAVVPMKDDQAGEVPVAFVVAPENSQITEDEVKQFVSKQVVFYKRLNRVFFIDAVPKSPSGKILRKELRAKLENGCS